MKLAIKVMKAGLLTTVQDGGRTGFQSFGVSESGAMDRFALALANVLVNNEPDAAALEITLLGPELYFETDRWIAICGGDFTPQVKGEPLPMWRPVFIPAGTLVRFDSAKKGCRAYIAFDGSIELPRVLGSSSTYLRAGFGGYYGRALASGDRLELGKACLRPSSQSGYVKWSVSTEWADMSDRSVVRVFPGPEYNRFSQESIEIFFNESYQISTNSDRMGYRLEGPSLDYQGESLLSEAVTYGTIQIPADGKPIVLMADRQTTGGYPRIGQVAAVDLPAIAQRRPGEHLWFVQITLEEAEQLLWERMQQFSLYRFAVKRALHRDGIIA